MSEIHVAHHEGNRYEVTVKGGKTTTHHVDLPRDYYLKLSGGKISEEDLIRRSFEFLLKHEPNTAIFPRFELATINRYFPDFEATMTREI
ncbi:MAG TPA: hypothetical protein PLS90_13480 [Candidatus Sumerlaeota bacterium]|nr:hypothetical protein [Candidatus Sumerlaeota bacterium]HPK03456.1 hypothetical protein [Candidatus Sumerlaeota bacterium]